ncbi:serine protease [Deinococcus aetherius]|uniref:Serine protease n=1 Tax=Deinococcus aetherius TaxID=200252 RepID=A0ABM8AFN7_9DEIO|nr:S8 family serine peptidase [Deinococcus aetherius]BDP42617.1 serine protease [Deinococcus aetherius]
MRKFHGILAIGLGLSLAACSNTNAPTAATVTSRSVTAQATSGTKAYLVGFKSGVGVNSASITKAGGQLKKSWKNLSAALVTLTPEGVAALQGDPSVEYVEADVTRHVEGGPSGVTDDPTTPSTDSGRPGLNPGSNTSTLWVPQGEATYGTVALKSPALNAAGRDGSGVAVCVADTGIDAGHPEFAGKLKGYANFMGDDHPTPWDGNEHGTHVSGTIFAQLGHGSTELMTGMDAGGVVGVAPGVNLYMARVLGDDGSGSSSGVVDGVNWCVGQLRSQGGTEDHVIVSLSLGSEEGSKTEQRAFAKAYEAGALVVAAAGNTGLNEPHYPASYPTVMAVGSINDKGNLSSFSTFGKQVELVAPGENVLSTVPRGMGSGADASAGGVSAYSSVLASNPTTLGDVTAQIAAAGGDGKLCSTDPNLAGKIALISRGTCSFAVKVSNAAKSGAVAAIVYNNTSGTIIMSVAQQQAIPSVSITQQDGQNTLAALANGPVTGHVKIYHSDYAYLNGTSMATPHVSAAAALVWARKPNLTNDQLRALLDNTATDLGANGRDIYFGHGLVNPSKALNGN